MLPLTFSKCNHSRGS